MDEPFSTQEFVSFVFFASNWESAIFGFPSSYIAPLWSVAIEEQFYLVWPVLLRTVGVQKLGMVGVAFLVAAFGTRAYLTSEGVAHPGIWCNSVARLDPFIVGAAVAVFLRGRLPRLPTRERVALVVVGSGAVITATRFVPMNAAVPSVHLIWVYFGVACACALVLVACLGTDKSWLAHPVLVYLGRISYGLYVFHNGVLHALHHTCRNLPPEEKFPIVIGAGLLLTILAATLSYQLLEKPFLRLKARWAKVDSRPE